MYILKVRYHLIPVSIGRIFEIFSFNKFCFDNLPLKIVMVQWNFLRTLKCEKYYFLHKYQTFEELSLAIDEYIRFYHDERYQKRLNGLSPMEYRAKAA